MENDIFDLCKRQFFVIQNNFIENFFVYNTTYKMFQDM